MCKRLFLQVLLRWPFIIYSINLLDRLLSNTSSSCYCFCKYYSKVWMKKWGCFTRNKNFLRNKGDAILFLLWFHIFMKKSWNSKTSKTTWIIAIARRWFIAQQSVKQINAIKNKWSFGYSSLGKVKWIVVSRTALVIVKLCTGGYVTRMGTLSASYQ